MTEKQFKIIKIIDESTFMINAGYMSDDINIGDKFKIIGNRTVPILDPETDDVIEELPTYKTYVVAIEVFESVSLCKTRYIEPIFRSKSESENAILALTKQLNNLYHIGNDSPGHYEEVPVNEEQLSTFDNHDDSPISLGDKVEIVENTSSSNEQKS